MAQQAGSIRSLMRGNILVLTVSRVIWSMSNSIEYPYLSLYILELEGSKPVIGLVNTLGGLAGLFLYPVGGYIADKSGRARLVGLATFLYASSFLLFIFVPSWQWLAVGIAYQQIVLFYMPALNAIMADSIPVGARGRVLSLTMAIPEAVRILIPLHRRLVNSGIHPQAGDAPRLCPQLRHGYGGRLHEVPLPEGDHRERERDRVGRPKYL